MASNTEVCRRFVDSHGWGLIGSNLSYQDMNRLVSYSTEIARRIDGVIYYSADPMTRTTPRHIALAVEAAKGYADRHPWMPEDMRRMKLIPVAYKEGDAFRYSRGDKEFFTAMWDRAAYYAMEVLTHPDMLVDDPFRNKVSAIFEHAREFIEEVHRRYPEVPDFADMMNAARLLSRDTQRNRGHWRSGRSRLDPAYNTQVNDYLAHKLRYWRTAAEVESERAQQSAVDEVRNMSRADQLRRYSKLCHERSAGGVLKTVLEREMIEWVDQLPKLTDRQLLQLYAVKDSTVSCQGTLCSAAMFRAMRRHVCVEAKKTEMSTEPFSILCRLGGNKHRLTLQWVDVLEGERKTKQPTFLLDNRYEIPYKVFEVIIEALEKEAIEHEAAD